MIQVIHRAHTILEHMSRQPERPCQLGELAELLKVSAPACSNIVRTLVELGYLRQLGKRRGYTLGPMIYSLNYANPYRHLVDIARPEVEHLAKRINIFVVLVAECGGKRKELLRMSGDSTISIENPAGSPSQLFSCATGTVILSHLDQARVKSLWESDGGERNALGINNFTTYFRQLQVLREAGEVVLRPRKEQDPADPRATAAMAVPILYKTHLIAALGIRLNEGVHDPETIRKVLSDCHQSANKISTLLNG